MAQTPGTPVIHLELHTPELARARSFYAEVFGWRSERVEAAGRSYVTLDLSEDLGGGIVECRTERPLWLPYVQVPEVAEATDRARLYDARVLLEPREGPTGWRSVVAVPDGGEIALWQPKR